MSESFLKQYKVLIFSTFFLIALGGSVRALDAGLACPDWPLCFGDVIPDFHVQVYFEFIHRAIAGLITLGLIYLNYKIMIQPGVSRRLKMFCGFTWFLIVVQIILGGLTVLWQLHEKVVAAHLGLGTAFLACLVWIYTSLKPKLNTAAHEASRWSRYFAPAAVVLLAIYGQIILGGLVASHYAANVCPTFPLCHGQLIPTLSGEIGLHVIHRLGAYTLFLIILSFCVFIYKTTNDKRITKYAHVLLALIVWQMTVGIANVLYKAPPLITVTHLATGAFMLAVATRFLRLTTIARQI